VDGTSNTIMFSEVLRGTLPINNTKLDVARMAGWGMPAVAPNNPNNRDYNLSCLSSSTVPSVIGLRWYEGSMSYTFYTHTVPPNHSNRDCVSSPISDQGHIASRSAHAGGVNSLFTDGCVRFIRDTIPLADWRALGTRAGNESIGLID
jgi:hypothetical protein